NGIVVDLNCTYFIYALRLLFSTRLFIFCSVVICRFVRLFFFFTVTATTEIYTLSLHDALPNSASACSMPTSIPDESTPGDRDRRDRKSTRLNSSHRTISYAVFCLKKKKIL